MKCRFCKNEISHVFIDLDKAPLSNSYLSYNQLNEPEKDYPLKVMVCEECWLVQVDEYKKSSEIFNNEYLYFSSYSRTWLEHAKQYTDTIIPRLKLNSNSLVIEIASNDGYLLQYFKEKDIPCLGVEPAGNIAETARKRGIETITDFFCTSLATELKNKNRKADLIIGNNVLAHVPDVNSFTQGLKLVLKNNGVITMEFPHLLQLVENNQFDTIYHEHFSYFSFHTVQNIFSDHGLEIFDVDEIPTHGGSLRIYARHMQNGSRSPCASVTALIEQEKTAGINKLSYYENFQPKAERVKYDLLEFLKNQKKSGHMIAAYGAAAKGNTLLNYCGITKDLISFVVDASEHKQGKFLPGSHIPILSEEHIKLSKPSFMLILPWNIKDEILHQLAYIKKWDVQFIIAIPHLTVL
ncbi:class I SAM-dependent methyltransferase [Desulfobacula sp.]|uniref:class I SAM-dependent methyltransferase n=1 Tax=Desulfobacula sp. TaxID=2593537 RepID=UPI002604957C|nr:class I SAM-dependent methyltransferase [Desulfobacula sp.]